MSKDFPRQNSFRFKKLGEKWRRPRGGQSKTRMDRKGRARRPKHGYGTPVNERFSINGIKPIFVNNIKDLENLKSGDHIMMSSAIGLRLAGEMGKIAKSKGLNIFNKKKVEKAGKIALRKKREKEVAKKAGDIPKPETKPEVQKEEVSKTDKHETKEKNPVKKKNEQG